MWKSEDEPRQRLKVFVSDEAIFLFAVSDSGCDA